MRIFRDFKQYSPEWWAVRRGVPTASDFGKIITAKTQKLAEGHQSYINRLIGDSLDEHYPRLHQGNGAMQRGQAMEPRARDWYQSVVNADVEEVGFVISDCNRFGFSPDGMVLAKRGGLEVKNPEAGNHVEWLRAGVIPDEHKAQTYGPLVLCEELEWWDFVSYCPGAPNLRVRATRDDPYCEKLKCCLETFWKNFVDALAQVEKRAGRHLVAAPHAVADLAVVVA